MMVEGNCMYVCVEMRSGRAQFETELRPRTWAKHHHLKWSHPDMAGLVDEESEESKSQEKIKKSGRCRKLIWEPRRCFQMTRIFSRVVTAVPRERH